LISFNLYVVWGDVWLFWLCGESKMSCHFSSGFLSVPFADEPQQMWTNSALPRRVKWELLFSDALKWAR
jgi:hypothetical protein